MGSFLKIEIYEKTENIRVGWIRVGEYGGGCGGVLWGGTVGRYCGGVRNT